MLAVTRVTRLDVSNDKAIPRLSFQASLAALLHFLHRSNWLARYVLNFLEGLRTSSDFSSLGGTNVALRDEARYHVRDVLCLPFLPPPQGHKDELHAGRKWDLAHKDPAGFVRKYRSRHPFPK